jgi:hypothetical protein
MRRQSLVCRHQTDLFSPCLCSRNLLRGWGGRDERSVLDKIRPTLPLSLPLSPSLPPHSAHTGKNFASRQTKWDALFMGIRAMGRDESIVSYAFRLILTMAFNFTLGGSSLSLLFALSPLTLPSLRRDDGRCGGVPLVSRLRDPILSDASLLGGGWSSLVSRLWRPSPSLSLGSSVSISPRRHSLCGSEDHRRQSPHRRRGAGSTIELPSAAETDETSEPT